MSSERDQAKDSAGPFQCLLCPNGSVCLRWHQTLLLHFGREDVVRILDCLEDILKQPSASFCLGDGPYCACRAGDGFCYLVCQDRVVLRLSNEEAEGLQSTLAAFRSGLGPHTAV